MFSLAGTKFAEEKRLAEEKRKEEERSNSFESTLVRLLETKLAPPPIVASVPLQMSLDANRCSEHDMKEQCKCRYTRHGDAAEFNSAGICSYCANHKALHP